MSQEKVDIVRASYEAFLRGDFEASLHAYSRDSEWDDRATRPDGRIHRGHEAIAEVVRTWRGTFSDYSWELEEMLDAGHETVIVYTERGRGKGSGAQVENRRGNVVTVDRGKIVRTVLHPIAEAALRAAGLAS